MLTTMSTRLTVALLLLAPAFIFAGFQLKSQLLLFWALALAAVMAAGVIAITQRYQSLRAAFFFAVVLATVVGLVAGMLSGWIAAQ